MSKTKNVQMEAMFIGSMYKKPDLYIEFGSLIKPKFDFSEDMNADLYNWFELFYNTQSEEINENKFTIFISQHDDKLKRYKEYGGWKTISKIMELCDPNDVDNYFTILKKFSLLREFEAKGFPVNKLMEKKNFDTMTPEDIVSIMRYNVDHINTVIGGGKVATILGSTMREYLEKWKLKPEMGTEYADWKILTEQFRGMRKKKILFNGMLSNQGKSRNMMYLASYIGLIKKEPILVMVNEMDENDMLACMVTTVLNNPIFGHCVNKIEREIVLGQYKDDEEEKRIFEVAKWIEESTNIFFMEMSSYSDKDLEREIKKYVLGRGVKYVFYDTLKGHKNEDWASIKQTGTLLKDLCTELDIGGWATLQLTDETINIKPHEMSSMNIASAKHLKHLCDSLTLYKQINRKEYDTYYTISEFGENPLDITKNYYYCKIDKNRAGTKLDTIFEVDLDRNIWKELGFAGVK